MNGRTSSEIEDPAELRLRAERLEAVDGVFISLGAPGAAAAVAPPPPPAPAPAPSADPLPPLPLDGVAGAPVAVDVGPWWNCVSRMWLAMAENDRGVSRRFPPLPRAIFRTPNTTSLSAPSNLME